MITTTPTDADIFTHIRYGTRSPADSCISANENCYKYFITATLPCIDKSVTCVSSGVEKVRYAKDRLKHGIYDVAKHELLIHATFAIMKLIIFNKSSKWLDIFSDQTSRYNVTGKMNKQYGTLMNI